jgi:hypothetical protein
MQPLYQMIKQEYELGPASHMLHFENLESVINEGGLISKNSMLEKTLPFIDISDESVQSGRQDIVIGATGKPLHDYVPLYFGNKTPMVATKKDIYESLIFLRFSLDLLEEYDCVICDRNARNNDAVFRRFKSIDDLEILNPKFINTVKYAKFGKDSLEYKQKQAELLVLNKLPLKYLHSVICSNSVVQTKVSKLLVSAGIKAHVFVNRKGYYFYDNL